MAQAVQLDATLPALGSTSIHFHNESAVVLDYIGDREKRRLRSVPHLGVAASVFTGINHSRLEYALLQCAVIGQIAKLHKDDEHLGIAAMVALNGLTHKVSSAEELLKCWALLSNYGHAQYTYGVERTLLQYAHADSKFEQWLLAAVASRDLKDWCRKAIREYDDEKMHHVMCLRRFRCERPRDRRKTTFVHYIRNLVLQLDQLFPMDAPQRYKMARLREVYRSVRLLSMVTLDAYYSGHPFRIQIGSAITNLAVLTEAGYGRDSFHAMLRRIAGWLADELYLHPSVVAVQREYEVRGAERFARRFKAARHSSQQSAHLFRQVMHDGLGEPRPGRLRHFLRLTFPGPRHLLLRPTNLLVALNHLQRDICDPPVTELSLDRNRFSDAIHVDFLYHDDIATEADIAVLLKKLRKWLTRSLEAEVLSTLRSMMAPSERSEAPTRHEEMRRRLINRQIVRNAELLGRVFWAVIDYLLPAGWSGRTTEYMPTPTSITPTVARVTDSAGVSTDLISPRLNGQITLGSPAVPPDRLQELRALQHVVERHSGALILACCEKFVIRDQYGKHRDDWDGVVLEIDDNGVRLTVVEAKNTGHRSTNETKAFAQLAATRDMIRAQRRLRYERRRIRGLGAYIQFRLG